jgi:hypothetical protein
MITIYSSKGVTCQPYNIATERIEDCREWLLAIDFIGWLAREVLSLLEKPIKGLDIVKVV